MIITDTTRRVDGLAGALGAFWELSGAKIQAIHQSYDASQGSPVFTVAGRYTTRGWTEWTQGFQYGSALLQFDATGEAWFLDRGKSDTLQFMAPHVTHVGVHDHGFNNVSTYGNLLRLAAEGAIESTEADRQLYILALQCSGAVQAHRWTRIANGEGYIYSFNGPQSLFSDTIRSLRVLALAHRLGHVLMGENDTAISLMQRLVEHARTTANYNVYYGEGRDTYDIRGRVAHESIFNVNDGRYRCPSTQQGYAAFTTWTRGLAWIMCGYAEQLEFMQTVEEEELAPFGGKAEILSWMEKAARATCDFYIEQTPPCGVPFWDTGAPDLHRLDRPLERPADPFNQWEPVDSSAAAIAAQGLLRLGSFLGQDGDGARYWQAGLTVMNTLLGEPYLSGDPSHQGLLLHSVYHRPNGWDAVPDGAAIPCGESSMWGDFHLREAALYLQRKLDGRPYYKFFLD
jgi:hypothetical protein